MGNPLMCIIQLPMYAVTVVTVKSKVTFAVLNTSFVDHSKHSKVNFQNRNTLENCRYKM